MARAPATQYAIEALADALISAHRWRDAAAPLRDFHVTRGLAFERAFGIDATEIDRSSRQWPLKSLVRDCVDALASRVSPFSGYLEAPPVIIAYSKRFGPAIDAAESGLRAAIRVMLVAALEELISPRKPFVTAQALLDHGFDATREEPDADDFF